jgi:hypothetical protein
MIPGSNMDYYNQLSNGYFVPIIIVITIRYHEFNFIVTDQMSRTLALEEIGRWIRSASTGAIISSDQ